MPAVSRDAIDRAAVDGSPLIEVLGPHARPPVLVPRDEMALALRLHAESYDRHLAAYLRSAAIDVAAIRRLGTAVCRALDGGPLTSSEIRRIVSRDHDSALLTSALVHLGLRGIVRRFPADARLDSAKYTYELLHPDDRPNLDAEGDTAAVARKAIELFLQRHAPATIEEICTWSVLTRKAGRAALSALDARPVAIPDGREAWLLPQQAHAWHAFDGTADDTVSLLPYRDPFVAARRPLTLLTDQSGATVLRDGRPKRVSEIPVLHHHSIVCRGELIGVWEYDPARRDVVARAWKNERALGRRIAEAAAGTAAFIREELGDAQLSAVDPPAARAVRLAFCDASPPAPRLARGVRTHASSSSRA